MIKRIITALVLLPIVIGMLFFVPSFPYLEIFIALFVGLCAWEWSGFCYNLLLWRISYCFIAVGLFFLLLSPILGQMVLIFACVLWIFALFRVLNHNRNPQSTIGILFTGFILICAGAISLFALKSIADEALLCVLLWVWSADTLGLLFGKLFGKNKLIPQVSPGKTWEGLYGAMFGSIILSIALGYFLISPEFVMIDYFQIIAIGVLVTLASVVGDLLLSCYKRQAGLDDTGGILPGHGGILDRVDGLLAAAPIAWVLMSVVDIIKV